MRSILKRKLKIGARNFLLALSLLICTSIRGQSLLFPADYFFDQKRQGLILSDTETIVHTSLQPYLYKDAAPDTFKKMRPGTDRFFDKLLYENLLELRHIDRSSGYNRKFNVDINPIVHFLYGEDLVDAPGTYVQMNSRGFWIKGELGRKLIFESAFIENQGFFPQYLKEYGKLTGVVPGQGRWKTFKNYGFDYASAFGILNFTASTNLTIRLGHGKQKVGHGYRSLLLSDNSFNYPYLQLIARFFRSKVQYSQTYALLMNLTDGGAKTPPNTERIFQKKPASFQQVSFRPGNCFNIYLFQGLIWKASDTAYTTHLDAFYANPLIFTDLAKFGFNDENHILVGGGIEVRLFKKFLLYNQAMYDGTYLHKSYMGTVTTRSNWAAQGGIKYYDAFGIRNLFLQFEANLIEGQSYVSSVSPYQHYSHYNQLLTTPALLTNEMIGFISYSYKGFFIHLKQNFLSDNYSSAAINYFDGKMGFMINPRYNLNISVGATIRSYLTGVSGIKAQEMQLYYINLRTSLYNLYYDF